jgi:hypothetical protein
MTPFPKSAAVVTPMLALAGVWGLLAFDPLHNVREHLMAAGGGRAEANVENLYTNASTQETSRSDDALGSLRRLEPEWCEATERTRFVLMGNSQTLAIVLSPSESPVAGAEKTYPDYLLDRLHESGAAVRGYRLSAPNLGYTEALWYLTYLVTHPCVTPTDLVLQLNFETFRKTGIRDRLLALLDDPAFAAAAEREAASPATYGPVLQQAIGRYRTQKITTTGQKAEASAATAATGVSLSEGAGAALETTLRRALDRSPDFRARSRIKGELVNSLYLGRVYFLGIKTSTKRSVSAATLALNVAAVERIGELCRAHGIRLSVFNAPQNPLVPLYQTEADRDEYHRVIADLARRFSWKSYDFENSLDKDMWGVWLDGPDPIHFGRAGHKRFAQVLLDAHVIPVNE